MPDYKQEDPKRRAPNPLIAIGLALVIIIGFIIAIFVAVAPALAP